MWNIKDNVLRPTHEGKKDRQNRQKDLMMASIIERLQQHDPLQLAENAGTIYDSQNSRLIISSLGQQIAISIPDYQVQEDLEMWHHLTLLQYLETADGTPLSDESDVISLTDMSGGLARGFGFNKDIEKMFAQWFKEVTPEAFSRACLDLGGKLIQGRGDAAAVLYYAPNFPITVNFWCADDEFPASGKTLLNRRAEHYLTIEAAGGACSTVVQAIRDRIRINQNS